MDKISFLTFTDIHVSDHNPQNRKGNYKKDILDKLSQIGKVGIKLDVDFYLCGGDLYDHKAPMRNSHNLNKQLMGIFNSYGSPVYATEGNHDLRNDSYVNFEDQPISVLYESGALVQLRNKIVEKGSLKVHLRAFPFEENPDLDSMPKAPDDVDCSVCIQHLYSKPEGGMLFKQKLYSYDEIGVLGDDIFLMGHYHVDQGVKIISTHGIDQHFINVGALSRGALSEDNIKRSPKICYVTITKEGDQVTIKTQQVKLKVKPVEEIFDLDKKEEEKKKIQEAEDFVDKLKQNISEAESEENSLDNEVASLDLDKKIMNKVKHFISEASLKVQDVLK
jgi:hypothetical protein